MKKTKPFKQQTPIPLKWEISYILNWLAVIVAIILFFALASCTVSKPQNSPQIWVVVSVQNETFRAKLGKEYATFTKLKTDSIYIGKKITVSRGIK